MSEIIIDKESAKRILASCDAILAKEKPEPFEPGRALYDETCGIDWQSLCESSKRDFAKRESRIIHAAFGDVERRSESVDRAKAMNQVEDLYPKEGA